MMKYVDGWVLKKYSTFSFFEGAPTGLSFIWTRPRSTDAVSLRGFLAWELGLGSPGDPQPSLVGVLFMLLTPWHKGPVHPLPWFP